MVIGEVGGGFGLCGSFGAWWFCGVVLLVGGAQFCVVVVWLMFVLVLGCVV